MHLSQLKIHGLRGIPLRRSERRAFNHPLAAYAEAVSADIGFASFFEWFREREDIESEAIRYRDPSWRDPQLNAVRAAITRIIPALDGGALRVQRTTQRMIIAKAGEELDVGQLSDGEKGLLALVGDLARRFAISNPNRPDPLQGEGIVLIDEIELHLHPDWQRTILNHPMLVEARRGALQIAHSNAQ